jgi:putative FmdB family regulatory protein
MPRYEFLCEKCRKPFELTMTISEHEKASPKCPKCKRTKVGPQPIPMLGFSVLPVLAKTTSDSPGEDPWATGGLSTPDDRRADGPPLYLKAVSMLRRSGPAQNDVIVRAGRMTAETTNSRRGSTLVAGRGPVDAGLCCPADVAMM